MPEMLARSQGAGHAIAFKPIPLKATRFASALDWHERVHRNPGNRLCQVFAMIHVVQHDKPERGLEPRICSATPIPCHLQDSTKLD